MDGLQNEILLRVGDGAFLLGVTAPEHVDDALPAHGDGADDGVGEGLPALSGVRGRFVGPHGEHRVEQQYALLGPAVEVARERHGYARVVGDLLENVLERRRKGYAVGHGETEAVGLSGSVVGVLPDDDHLQAVERAFVECAEDVAAARKNAVRGIFAAHEIDQSCEIGLLEFGSQQFLPVGGYFYIHRRFVCRVRPFGV